jgi:hypothetical protein
MSDFLQKNFGVTTIPLGAANNNYVITQRGNYLQVLRFQDANGNPLFDGVVNVAVDQGQAPVPLAYNSKIRADFNRLTLSWKAQPGYYAVILLGNNEKGAELDVDSPPFKSLLTGTQVVTPRGANAFVSAGAGLTAWTSIFTPAQNVNGAIIRTMTGTASASGFDFADYTTLGTALNYWMSVRGNGSIYLPYQVQLPAGLGLMYEITVATNNILSCTYDLL